MVSDKANEETPLAAPIARLHKELRLSGIGMANGNYAPMDKK